MSQQTLGHLHHQHHRQSDPGHSLMTAGDNRAGQPKPLMPVAVQATLHCLTGCAIGEILGLVIGTALRLGMWQTVALAVALAFVSGFGLTMLPLLKSGIGFRKALRIAFAADFVSVLVMEIVDNAVVMVVPGAMMAGLGEPLFWSTLALGLAIAFVVALPINYWLLRRGKGHAVVHAFHNGH